MLLPRSDTTVPWSSCDESKSLRAGRGALLFCTSVPSLMTYFINHVVFLLSSERERERENRLTEGAQAVERRQFLVTLRMKCISHPIVLNMKPPQKHILRHPSKWDSLFKSVKKKKEPHNNVTAEELWQLRFLHAADTYRTDTFYVSFGSHFMFMTSLEGDGAPKQGRQLKAVFQHL